MKTKRKAFSMVELLGVLLIMGTLASIATENFAQEIKLKKYLIMENSIQKASTLTQKIIDQGYYATTVDYTTTSGATTYTETVDTTDYNYIFNFVNLNFKQYKIKEAATADYTTFGIILIDTLNEFDKNCVVFNNETDSKFYWSDVCDPDSLGWDYST